MNGITNCCIYRLLSYTMLASVKINSLYENCEYYYWQNDKVRFPPFLGQLVNEL